jgi:hypothetical protein
MPKTRAHDKSKTPTEPPKQRGTQEQSAIVSVQMKLFGKKGSSALWCFSAFLLLSGCGQEEPECGSLEARTLVVKTVANDKNNSLVNYAVKNSSAVAEMIANSAGAKARSAAVARGEKINDESTTFDANAEAEKLAIWEKAKEHAVYTLDDTVIMNARMRATRAVSCSGLLSVTVADTTAQKQVDFTVEQSVSGKISVSVKPFLF